MSKSKNLNSNGWQISLDLHNMIHVCVSCRYTWRSVCRPTSTMATSEPGLCLSWDNSLEQYHIPAHTNTQIQHIQWAISRILIGGFGNIYITFPSVSLITSWHNWVEVQELFFSSQISAVTSTAPDSSRGGAKLWRQIIKYPPYIRMTRFR